MSPAARGGPKLLPPRGRAVPTCTFDAPPGEPRVGVARLDVRALAALEPAGERVHDFLVLAYFERGGGVLRVGAGEWPVAAGDAFVLTPGDVVGVAGDRGELGRAGGWSVWFPPEGLGASTSGGLLSWRGHPLLFPFVRGAARGAQRLTVPVEDRARWTARLVALEEELGARREGYAEAVSAHLTLLLVDVARIAIDVAGALRLRDEPVLAEVFSFIEAHYREPISLRDVAAAVNVSGGHLTTVVRLKTGRPVNEWITELRMAQARRLLADTDLTVGDVGDRVGYPNPVYFVRTFRRAHGTTPLRWRRAARG